VVRIHASFDLPARRCDYRQFRSQSQRRLKAERGDTGAQHKHVGNQKPKRQPCFCAHGVIDCGIYQVNAMPRTARLFRNGRSQAVRLPADFRFEGSEVFIRQDPASGDVILSRRPESWESFFQLAQQARVPEDFMADRADTRPQKRDLY